jgi:hypothetical protein
LACSSSVRNPADLTASASSLILEDCRAFILAVSGSGRWLRACTRATEDGRNKSDECDSMLISLWLAAGSPALECSSGAGCREHDRLSERVIVDVPRRHDANRPPGWAARNKDSTRPTRKAPPRRSRAFVFAISCAGFGGPSQVRAVASTVVASPPFRFLFRCAAPPFLPPARKKSVFPTILRRRKLSVTNVTRLDFIFVMSDIQNANRSPFSAGLPNWHPAGTATRSRGSATQMLERPNMKPCRSTLNVAPRARVLRYR